MPSARSFKSSQISLGGKRNRPRQMLKMGRVVNICGDSVWKKEKARSEPAPFLFAELAQMDAILGERGKRNELYKSYSE